MARTSPIFVPTATHKVVAYCATARRGQVSSKWPLSACLLLIQLFTALRSVEQTADCGVQKVGRAGEPA